MFVQNLFNSLSTLKGQRKFEVSFNEVMNEIKDYLQTYATDRRYTVKVLASTTSFCSMLIMYKGVKYYITYNYKDDLYTAEISN